MYLKRVQIFIAKIVLLPVSVQVFWIQYSYMAIHLKYKTLIMKNEYQYIKTLKQIPAYARR